MSVQQSTMKMLTAVNAVVDKARKRHEGIPETVVVLGASGVTRTGQKHGHYAPSSWGTRTDSDAGEAGVVDDAVRERDLYGEIFLAGESLSRGAVATVGTILHELVHAYCNANDIQDTSNGHRYHNAKFRDKAEEFGLSIEKADTIGWSVTTVPEGTQQAYAAEIAALEEAITVSRLGYLDLAALGLKDPDKEQPLKRKMQCPLCEEPLLVTKKWWEKQGSGGGDYEYGAGLICREHDIEYEIFEEGGKQ